MHFRQRVFTTPFRIILAGGSGSGKSTWLIKFVHYCSHMFKSITVFYQILNPSLSKLLVLFGKKIALKQGIPSQEDVDELDGEQTMWIIEDAMSEIGVSKTMAQLITRVSSHCSLSVCLTLQNLFDKGPQIRTITLSATHLILFRSIRHQTMINTLNSQMMWPKNFLSSAMKDCSRQDCFSPLIIVLTPQWDDHCRVFSGKKGGRGFSGGYKYRILAFIFSLRFRCASWRVACNILLLAALAV